MLSGADAVSVFIRATLTPFVTPASARGRVLAVEHVFIGASNELGAFESGVAGQVLGVAPAVVLGGVMTLVVAGLWSMLFPSLRDVDRFQDAQEASELHRRARTIAAFARGGELSRVRAWAVGTSGPHRARTRSRPSNATEPMPAAGEIRVAVSVCGVCRTDLHLAEGDLVPRRFGVVPGHEVVGRVDCSAWARRGSRSATVSGSRGCATPAACAGSVVRGDENLCVAPRFTGWDDDGGYAERAVVDERYAYALPSEFDDEHAAPLLLCRDHRVPSAATFSGCRPGGRLGVYGFGASAHIAAQVAMFEGATVHVLTRSADAQRLALEPRRRVRRATRTTRLPSRSTPRSSSRRSATWCPSRSRALDRGGTLAIAGIHLSDIPTLSYEREVFQERTVTSVTANTRRDGEELLDDRGRGLGSTS